MACAVTGAFSYTGKYLTRLLLQRTGHNVVNLTNHPNRAHGFSERELARVRTQPLDFSSTDALAKRLEGVSTLYCTYWIRFARDGVNHDVAAERLSRMWAAAKLAGVQKVLLSTHTHATVDSPFDYIRGKATAAQSLRDSGLRYGIVRPCGIFGDTADESILLNNAAWVCRRTPLFLLPGDGTQIFQPVHVQDMAELMFELGEGSGDADERDACGPDALTSREFFTAVAKSVSARALVLPSGLPADVIWAATLPLNWMTGDVLLDRDDLHLLVSGLTRAEAPADPAISKRRSVLAWLKEVGSQGLGQRYISSVQRYYH